ncbi:TetR/AcrR family transcriptional regulator [Chitinophaga filiformis]|uniref:TetR/AcrR family transcriptional regulator n=1 Tax=Chitinophaga filiformis TaxID=104663 RepID=A0ABY4HUF2_CHIFI|nr:TetR/AcrR family transcriptional regulator [Chitinophaga filiformis]UPK67415.1 TetR/AcrR family transcriptional regulator [Chitinophaga filiformis]
MPKAKEQFEEMRQEAVRKIKTAGLELFARKGLAGTNIKEIAEKAQISLGLMYHYYSSKDELYLALANEAMDMSIALLSALKKQRTGAREKVEGFIHGFLTGVQKHPEICYFIIIGQQFETKDDSQNDDLNTRKLKSLELLAAIIKAGQREGIFVKGDPLQLAVMLVAATQGLAAFKMTFGSRFTMPQTEILLNMLII